VNLPVPALRAMVPRVEAMVGRELAPAARCRLRWITAILCSTIRAPPTKRLGDRGHLLDLAALGLGAQGDHELAAQRGGLRAVRLKPCC